VIKSIRQEFFEFTGYKAPVPTFCSLCGLEDAKASVTAYDDTLNSSSLEAASQTMKFKRAESLRKGCDDCEATC